MDISSPEEGEAIGGQDGSSGSSDSDGSKPSASEGRRDGGKTRKEADEDRRRHIKLTEQAREMLARFSIKDGTGHRGRRK